MHSNTECRRMEVLNRIRETDDAVDRRGQCQRDHTVPKRFKQIRTLGKQGEEKWQI